MSNESIRNPFIFGRIAQGEAFVNRTREVAGLVRDLTDHEKVFLLSPRRYGKTSLIAEVFRRLEAKGFRTITIQVSSSTTYTQFLERFATEVVRVAGTWEQIKVAVTTFLREVKPIFKFDGMREELQLSFTRSHDFDPVPVAPEVFALPERMASHGGFRMAICLDEFQDVAKFNGGSVENALRDAVQRQERVGYVFSGSKTSMLEEMRASDRPFHKAGPTRYLDKIPAAEWHPFIAKQFVDRGRGITRKTIDHLLITADLVPYLVQRIAHELWDAAELSQAETLDVNNVDAVVSEILSEDGPEYEQKWQSFTAGQQSVLAALAAGERAMHSKAAQARYEIGPQSSISTALQLLGAHEVIAKHGKSYAFVDPLFPLWILEHKAGSRK